VFKVATHCTATINLSPDSCTKLQFEKHIYTSALRYFYASYLTMLSNAKMVERRW